MTSNRAVSLLEGQNLAKKHKIPNFIETSAFENSNVENLFIVLTQDIVSTIHHNYINI